MYYFINKLGVQEGPYDTNKLLSKGITKETMVWTNGMKEWTKAGEVDELKVLFPPVPPVPPTPQPTPTPPPTPQPTPNPQPAPTPQFAPGEQSPNNYMVWSILTTLLCCLPAGIAAIIYSSKVDKAWAQGNKAEAQKSSEQAKLWCMISAAGGVIVVIFSFIAGFLGAL